MCQDAQRGPLVDASYITPTLQLDQKASDKNLGEEHKTPGGEGTDRPEDPRVATSTKLLLRNKSQVSSTKMMKYRPSGS